MFCKFLLCKQVFLNYLTNYVPGVWSESGGCRGCEETSSPLPEDKEAWPAVLVAVSVPSPSPFLAEMLERVSSLDYPLSHLSLFIHNQVSITVTVSQWNALLLLFVTVCSSYLQGCEWFCIFCRHVSKRNGKPTIPNILTIVGGWISSTIF